MLTEDGVEIIEEDDESVSKLPWFIDWLLFPANVSGIVNVVVFWLVISFISFLQNTFNMVDNHLTWLTKLFSLFAWGYVLNYLVENIRYSAIGKRRAMDV